MERATFYLPKELKRLLALRARREGRSQGEIIREALARYLARPESKSLGAGEDVEVSGRTAEAWLEAAWQGEQDGRARK
ncbi:ribbon-helix-helix domain-containing protein [Thermus oshimai]|uniref:ribbon-helix-helix domain-containing protein n=1 Tax=Thermus oshimai TaxID=56957 RepID=UPI00057071A4|nr:CopG family transcriptional regulator [Thermus oshimai]